MKMVFKIENIQELSLTGNTFLFNTFNTFPFVDVLPRIGRC